MNKHLTNIESASQLSEDKFSIKYKGRKFKLALNNEEDTITPKLTEELKIRELKFSDLKTHKFFEDCKSAANIKEKFKQYILQGKVDIVEDKNQYHIVLYDNISELIKEKQDFNINKEIELIKEVASAQFFIKDNLSKLNQIVQDNLKNCSQNYHCDLKRLEDDFNCMLSKLRLLKAEEENIKCCINKIENLITSEFDGKIEEINSNIKLGEKIKIRENLKSLKCDTDFKTNIIINKMLKLSADLIILGCSDGLKIWDIKKKEIQLEKPFHEINNLILLTTNYIISSSEYYDYYLNKFTTSIDIWGFEYRCRKIYESEEPINCLAPLASGQFAAGQFETIIVYFNEENCNYKQANKFKAHDGTVLSLVYLKDSCLLISGSSDENIKFWNKNYECVKLLKNFGVVFPLITLPNETLIAGKDGQAVKIWESATSVKEISDFKNNITHGIFFDFKSYYYYRA
jgi:WD40 repeat protein